MAEELFDIVNDHDEVIGQERRSFVHGTGLLHRGAHVLLFTPDGRMLVQQRSSNRPESPSALDCSVSEHVKAGENYLTAARRGLREELGLEGIELEPIITFRMSYGPNDNEICRLFQGPLVDPALVHFDTEEVAWVDYATVPDLHRMRKTREKPFTRWLEQLTLWMAGEPSELSILSVYGAVRPEAYRNL